MRDCFTAAKDATRERTKDIYKAWQRQSLPMGGVLLGLLRSSVRKRTEIITEVWF